MTERTFLTPLNEAEDLARECKEELAMLARALHITGNSALADRLGAIGVDLNSAIALIREGASLSLKNYVGATESATGNMVKAALAVAARG